MQNSVLFYHISQNDTALEVMCESGWGYVCGINGINATLSIPTTDTQPGKYTFLFCYNYIHSNLDEFCEVVFIIMNTFPLRIFLNGFV